MNVIYLDHHSTTPVDKRVLDVMLPYFSEAYGNASSGSHAYGWQAEEAVDLARGHVASLMGAHPSEVTFTSGATESIGLALLGVAENYCSDRSGHFITQVTEHSAVLETCQELERRGHRVTYLPVNSEGLISLDDLDAAISDDTVLVSIMHANNEIGTIQPIQEIGEVCAASRVMLHVDAAQTFGLVPISVKELGISLLSVSSHKLYGPKGVGALYTRRRGPRVQLRPRSFGGGHEGGRRAGTLNVPGIVGFGHAAKIASEEMVQRYGDLMLLRERLEEGLAATGVPFSVNGALESRLPHNSNLTFPGISAEDMILECRSLALSTTAACASSEKKPSHVILALGHPADYAASTIRIGLGKDLTLETIDKVVEILSSARTKLAEKEEAND
ncbi:MAG: cysteine desulfurase family protein [Myxococcota bacterium]|nr:cysteine desulfurase family protein [Myxococcota bacterium]